MNASGCRVTLESSLAFFFGVLSGYLRKPRQGQTTPAGCRTQLGPCGMRFFRRAHYPHLRKLLQSKTDSSRAPYDQNSILPLATFTSDYRNWICTWQTLQHRSHMRRDKPTSHVIAQQCYQVWQFFSTYGKTFAQTQENPENIGFIPQHSTLRVGCVLGNISKRALPPES